MLRDKLVELILKMIIEYKECENMILDPGIISDRKRFAEVSKRYFFLKKIYDHHCSITSISNTIFDLKFMLQNEMNEEMIDIINSDIDDNEKKINELYENIGQLLIPKEFDDSATVIMDLRAGTGGEEAALFCRDIVRMYNLYSDYRKWRFEILNKSDSLINGYKDALLRISGDNVYRDLQFEGGGHRVQRIPDTESQGRVHTSMITIAVLIEPDVNVESAVNLSDLIIETCRSGGAGGQHVNTTDSAVRVTHVPTGITVRCEDQRSQHANKERAIKIIIAKINEEERIKNEAKNLSEKKLQAGSGERNERIRTYNFSQNRLTDHRINKSWHNLDMIMEGELDDVIESMAELKARKASEVLLGSLSN